VRAARGPSARAADLLGHVVTATDALTRDDSARFQTNPHARDKRRVAGNPGSQSTAVLGKAATVATAFCIPLPTDTP
jgi:hypothetical protein